MKIEAIDRRALLSRVELFQELDRVELDSVVALTRARLYPTRAVVVRQGEAVIERVRFHALLRSSPRSLSRR